MSSFKKTKLEGWSKGVKETDLPLNTNLDLLWEQEILVEVKALEAK